MNSERENSTTETQENVYCPYVSFIHEVSVNDCQNIHNTPSRRKLTDRNTIRSFLIYNAKELHVECSHFITRNFKNYMIDVKHPMTEKYTHKFLTKSPVLRKCYV